MLLERSEYGKGQICLGNDWPLGNTEQQDDAHLVNEGRSGSVREPLSISVRIIASLTRIMELNKKTIRL